VNACTIVSRRELSRARALVSTFREHHPDPSLKFTVALLDGVAGAEAVKGAEVRQLDELLGAEGGLKVAGNPSEALDAVVLPYLLRYMLEEDSGPVVYLAPGLRVLGPLVELEQALEQSGLALVARAAPERPQDAPAFGGQKGGGALSRRLLAVRAGEGVVDLLESWPRWFQDGGEAVQSWFDGLPAIAGDATVLREPGYGLDPWTLGAWQANGNCETLEVGGKPARVFDFSSLDPLNPERLCDTQEAIQLSSVPALAKLCQREAQELLEAGWAQDMARAERLEVLGDGTRMTPTLRRLLVEGVNVGELSHSPFSDAGRAELFVYLNAPAQRGQAVGLTRAHLAIWEDRLDVQAAYPHLDGPDGEGYAGWLCLYGAEQEGLVPELLPPAPELAYRDANPHAHADDLRWGVNVAGFFNAELGVGEAARLLISGLDAAGVPLLPVQGHLIPPSRQGANFVYARIDDAPYPINIVCINGDGVPVFAREAGRSFFEDRYTIALWWWEVSDPPASWSPAYELIDEVWVASQHLYDAIAPTSPVPVVRIGLPVVVPTVAPRTRAELGLPEDGFLFLYVHDYHSVAARKNPCGAIEAFKRAFAPGEGAKLVVKSINAQNLPHEHDRVLQAADGHPDITLIDAYVSAAEKNAMIAACDCYVSLHRSEGFGLTVAEAMLLGKPVIATRYGGTLEFTNDDNSYLVDWRPVKVGEGAHPYPAEGIWADPDLDQAAALMRKMLADPERARERGGRARSEVIERHSPRVAGALMRERLRTIHEQRSRAAAGKLNVAHLPALDMYELPELIASEARTPGVGRGARVKRAVQRMVTRLLRPFLARQREVDRHLVDSVERLDMRLREVTQLLQTEQWARFAQALALTRGLRAGLDGVSSELGGTSAELGGTRAELDVVRAELAEAQPAVRLQRLEQMGGELTQHLAEHRARPYVAEGYVLESWRDPVVGSVLGFHARGVSGVVAGEAAQTKRAYIDFEAAFRGPEERVRDIQRAYLPLLASQAPVLDVGCGRGEMLDLLTEIGVEASGVDVDAGMVEHARAKGHEVALGDAVAHLRTLAPGTLGAVVSLEVIEHLPYAELLDLLTLAHSRLREDGVLLLETVNPHAVDAMKAFWLDPTHKHPLFPEVTLELCRLTGFAEGLWFHPIGSGDFASDRNRAPIYAILARPRSGSAGD
jgi:glycosyltransferase involved in cell wall biosynthesis/2-polyprenyl-3-methyl-5-hydroxy-6-metoxy-1,4-benzoquinol methylase